MDGGQCLYLIHSRILPHSEVLDSIHLVCQQVDTVWFSRKRQTAHYEGCFDWSPQLLLSHWIRSACAPYSWWRTLIPPVHAHCTACSLSWPITRLASSDTLPHLRQLLNKRIRNLARLALDIPHNTTQYRTQFLHLSLHLTDMRIAIHLQKLPWNSLQHSFGEA